ncbi:Putative methylesterase 6 [Cytospora mali]|uniref:Methylesterase 6 n=1 Tax=Cytospora mali TaxID=578113 RepID=A0A194WCC5_CYTMA|nr:Putative methylesterase 6 [Valsa mali]
MSTPSILLVPGSFSLPEFYDEVVRAVKAGGIDVEALHLPSVGVASGLGREGTPPSMYDDAAFIAERTTKLADEGREVIIVAHSYGGVPASESAKGMSKSDRQQQGKQGGLVRIAYITALVPAVGSAALDVLASIPQDRRPELTIEGNGWMVHLPRNSAAIVFSGLPREEGEAWIRRFPQHSAVSFTSPLTHAGYLDVPVSYLVCEDDLTIPVDTQREGIGMVERESGTKVDVTTIKTDHCPMASAPHLMVNWIMRLATQG